LSAANAASGAVGIFACTQNANSAVTIENYGDIAATNAPSAGAAGIFAYTQGANSAITIENHGDIAAIGSVAFGIRAVALDGPIAILSDGAIQLTSSNNALGIDAVGGGNSPIAIENHGNIAAAAGNNAYGIHAGTYGASSPIDIVNSGDVAASSIGNSAFGISVRLIGSYSPVSIVSSGDFSVTGVYGFGIRVNSYGGYNPISIENSGDFVATSTGRSAYGIAVLAYSPVDIENSDAFAVNSAYSGFGIRALTLNGTSPISIENSGAFAVNAAGGDATGIFAYSRGTPLRSHKHSEHGRFGSRRHRLRNRHRHQGIRDRKRGEDCELGRYRRGRSECHGHQCAVHADLRSRQPHRHREQWGRDRDGIHLLCHRHFRERPRPHRHLQQRRCLGDDERT
jgi:hypothetical protein